MNKFLILCSLIVFAACSKEKKEYEASIPTDVNSTEMTTPQAKPEGLVLIESADCLSCHKNDSKLVGPSYNDIAAKYGETDKAYLAQKIIDGGKGVWGEMPMAPHPGLSKEQATKMVEYILTLK